MSFQTVVDDVKGRVESITATGQKVAQISIDTLKAANEIVVDKFQALVKTETDAAKEIFTTAKTSFEKAKTDGIKAVASAPISYLPPREKFITVFNETVTIVSTTGDELYKALKVGFVQISDELKGEAAEVEAAASEVVDAVAGEVDAATKKVKATVKKAKASLKKGVEDAA